MNPDCPLCALPSTPYGDHGALICLNPVCQVFTFVLEPEGAKATMQKIIRFQQGRRAN